MSRAPALYCTNRKFSYTRLHRPQPGWLTCKITNVIYCITCKKCKMQYIGQTGRDIGIRIYEHVRSVAHPNKTHCPVGKHFAKKDHKTSDLMFSVVQWIQRDPISSKSYRLQQEDFWICHLDRSIH